MTVNPCQNPGALILVTILGVMTPGMVFTIEPCVSEGDRRVKILSDGWTAITLVSYKKVISIW